MGRPYLGPRLLQPEAHDPPCSSVMNDEPPQRPLPITLLYPFRHVAYVVP
jgi:hypothetical protein